MRYNMKKIKYLISVLLIVLLTGCTNYDMSMNINKNKSMDLSISIMSSSKSELDSYIDNLKSKYQDNGFTILEFTSDNNYGIRISKHYDNIDNNSFAERSEEFDLLYLYDNEFDSKLETKIFNVDKGFSNNRYAGNFFVDLTNRNLDLSNVKITFTVTLPKGSISNNANNVSEDGNTLVWNITNSGKTDIDFVFELNSYDTIYLIIAIIIAIFLVFAIISALLSKSGDVSSSDIDNDLELLSNSKNNNINKQNNSSSKNIYSNYMNNNRQNENKTKKDIELVRIKNEEKSDKEIDNLIKNVSIIGDNNKSINNTNNSMFNNNDLKTNNNDSVLDNFSYVEDVKSKENSDKEIDDLIKNVSIIENNNGINNINVNNNLDINKSDSIIDNFNYEEEVKEEDNTYDDISLNPNVIRVNNKEVVVTKNNGEDE